MASGLNGDLVEKILLLLPVKSIVRFLLTCTEWNALIRQKRFIKSQLGSQTPKTSLFLQTKVSEVWKLEIEESSSLIYTHVQNFPDRLIRSLSHCDGLLICSTRSLNQLLPNRNELVVWKSGQKRLRWIEKEDLSLYDFYTLGRTSDMIYKVLRFSFGRFDQRVSVFKPDAEIFELDSNSWRHVDMEEDWEIYLSKLEVVSLNQNSFWLATTSKGKVFLQSFNFSSETFRAFEAPPGVQYEIGKTIALSSTGDHLFLLYQPHQALSEFWISDNRRLRKGMDMWEKIYVVTGKHSISRFSSFIVKLNENEIVILSEHVSGTVAQINLMKLAQGGMNVTLIDTYESKHRSTNCSYIHTLVSVPI